MWQYQSNNTSVLCHGGKSGMKWGFSKGAKNGKRTATEAEKSEEVQKLKDKKATEAGTAYINEKLRNRSDAPPKEYQPPIEESTFGEKKGFVDEYDVFYEGTYEQVRRKKYVHDLARAQMKMDEALKEAQQNQSPGEKILSKSSELIDKGKAILDKLFK